jgi:hypothetical protein
LAALLRLQLKTVEKTCRRNPSLEHLCLATLQTAERTHIEATEQAQRDWVRHVAEVAGRTLFLRA